MCVGITIIKWDSTCHSQTHGTEPPVHFCCSHYISPCFLSTPPFHSLSLSCFLFLSLSLSFSLSLSLSLPPLALCGCKTHVIWCPLPNILFLINLTFHTISFQGSYKIHQLFTDYLLRLPSSELLEKHLFRSRANRRLVKPACVSVHVRTCPCMSMHARALSLCLSLSLPLLWLRFPHVCVIKPPITTSPITVCRGASANVCKLQ